MICFVCGREKDDIEVVWVCLDVSSSSNVLHPWASSDSGLHLLKPRSPCTLTRHISDTVFRMQTYKVFSIALETTKMQTIHPSVDLSFSFAKTA